MAIQIATNRYVRSHGKEPKGRGAWAFIVQLQTDEHVLWVPAECQTYTQACRFAKRHLRAVGLTDVSRKIWDLPIWRAMLDRHERRFLRT